MKRRRGGVLAVAILLVFSVVSYAAEHGGKEHGGMEHGVAKTSEPSKSDIQDTMKKYVEEKSAAGGSFLIFDTLAGKERNLKLERVHERVGKTGNYYYSCADFRDIDSGELLDLDLDVQYEDGKLSVKDARIHKVEGKERYTYDEQDNRIPVKE